MMETAINDIEWVEPLSFICSLGRPVNKHLMWRPKEGWALLILTLRRAYDATGTAEKKHPLCICLKWADARSRIIPLSREEAPFSSCLKSVNQQVHPQF